MRVLRYLGDIFEHWDGYFRTRRKLLAPTPDRDDVKRVAPEKPADPTLDSKIAHQGDERDRE